MSWCPIATIWELRLNRMSQNATHLLTISMGSRLMEQRPTETWVFLSELCSRWRIASQLVGPVLIQQKLPASEILNKMSELRSFVDRMPPIVRGERWCVADLVTVELSPVRLEFIAMFSKGQGAVGKDICCMWYGPPIECTSNESDRSAEGSSV